MKRLLALLLTLVLVMSLFVACDSKKKDRKDDDDTTEATNVATDVVPTTPTPSEPTQPTQPSQPDVQTPATNSIDGTWTCTIDGSELLGEEAAGISIDMSFVVNGTTCALTTTVMGQSETINGTVSADQKIATMDGEPLNITVSGNTLTLTDSEGVGFSFTKAAGSNNGAGTVVTPDAKSELDGTWNCVVDAATILGDDYKGVTLNFTFVVNGDQCSLGSSVGGGEASTLSGTVSADKKSAVIEGETMILEQSGNTLKVTDSEGFVLNFTK